MAIERILIVDDDFIIRKSLEDMLRKKRYAVVSAPTLADAQRYLAKEEGYDLVLADIRLPDGDGTTLLEHISHVKKPPLVVMITAHGTIESAVSCMRAGAFDYVVKPFSP